MKLIYFQVQSSSPGYLIEKELQESCKKEETMLRLVDMSYFLNTFTKICNHNKAFDCSINNLILVGETRTGLISKFKFKCNYCGLHFFVHSSDPNPRNVLDVNKATVSGIMSTGLGFSQFEELSVAMGLPLFTSSLYCKTHDMLCEEWQNSAAQAMQEAAYRERDAAIKEGRVNKDGIALIDVIADGCWSKRSYKNNYSALSGAAAIVGRKYGQVLYVGIRNKYCCICARAETKKIKPKNHKCFKNYSGPSTGMEADILVDGFKQSLDMYNIIYRSVIADGDSSTYKKILEARPYPNITVEKIECRNHVLRNMCNKLRALTKDTKYVLSHRKTLTDLKVLRMRKIIRSAIIYNKNKNLLLSENINNLFKDITNTPLHVFDNHSSCKAYFCNDVGTNKNNEILLSAFWLKIKAIVGCVASHSRSLINDVDSNDVERFNGIVAKFVGGKRINFSLKQSYQARCSAAVVSYNTKKPLYTLQKSILGCSPSSGAKKLEERRIRKNELVKKYLRKKTRSKVLSKTDHNYGTNCSAPDMAIEELNKCKEVLLDDLKTFQKNRDKIERDTILQRDSSEWLELRRKMITASNFGVVIKRRNNISCAPLVKTLLYRSNISYINSIAHGIENEQIALQQLSRQENVVISPCGLFIDVVHPFLGATPDGLSGEF